jgi:uncharacterized protein YneF (UPF0154 family)
MKSKSAILVLLIVLAVLIGVTGGFFISKAISQGHIQKLEEKAKAYDMFFGDVGANPNAQNFVNKNTQPTNPNPNITRNEINTTTTPGVVERRFQKQGENKFVINIDGLKTGDIIDEYVTPELRITIKMENVDSYGPEWSISVNGSEPAYRETSVGMADELEFYYTNQYILYKTCDGTDIRSSKLVAINNEGKLVKEIYEYDEDNKGLVLRDVECDYNALIVKASRFGHGETIYADKYYKASPGELSDEAYEKIPGNVVLSAIYVYKIGSDGSIDFNNPQVINTQTFKEYVEDYLYNSTDETDLTTKMHEFLERNK